MLDHHYKAIVANMAPVATGGIQLSRLQIAELTTAPPRKPPSQKPPRNRHALRALTTQADKIRKFLLDNARSFGSQLHERTLSKLFKDYVAEAEGAQKELTAAMSDGDKQKYFEVLNKWNSRAFNVNRSKNLYEDSIQYMRQSTYKEILRESLGTLVDQYLDEKFRSFAADIERTPRTSATT